jgi:hypothetical protein
MSVSESFESDDGRVVERRSKGSTPVPNLQAKEGKSASEMVQQS